MGDAESRNGVLDLVRSANAEGERALACHDLLAAERAFTAALEYLGDPGEADQATGDLAAAAQIGLGRVHLATHDIRAADLRFDQAQRLRPTSPDGFYWAGCTAAHGAGYPRAEWLLTTALKLDRNHGKAYLQRAYVRLRQRQPDLALPDLLAAADHQVTNDNARLLTAALLARQGDAGRVMLVEAVARGLSGRRADAAAQLARAAARAPADHRISHAQAVLHLHTLSAAECGPPDLRGWRTCIGAWVAVRSDEDFWIRWRKQAQRRYDCPVSEDAIRAARTALDELLEQRLPSDDLVLLLRRERTAATLLARVGGLPDADPAGRPLVCGPLRIAELGLQQRLSEFLRSLPAAEDDTVQLFQQFSEIGLAVARFAADRPRAAATAALDLRCASCARTGGPTRPALISEPLLCEPECPEFDRHNPAFCAFADKYDELAKASAMPAARILLGIARDDITKATMDLSDARTCWRGALTLAKRFNQHGAILHEIVDDALGRALALSKRGDLTGAIGVLDAVHAVIPAQDTAEHHRVATELSSLLGARGVGLFNDNIANIDRAHADLLRAVELRPDLPRPRANLAVVLQAMAHRALRKFDLAEAIRLLSRCVEQFEVSAAMHDTESARQDLARARAELNRLLDDYGDRSTDTES